MLVNLGGHIDGNASKSHIQIFHEIEILRKYIFDTILYKVSKLECKVYQNGKYKIGKHSVASLF